MIQLNEVDNIFTLEVPNNLNYFYIPTNNSELWCSSYKVGEPDPHIIKYEPNQFEGLKILGIVTKEKINFNVKDIVKNLFTDEAWKDYRIKENKGWGSFPFLTSEESFYSLLEANELYFNDSINKLLIFENK
jgi:hypothetical protein